MTVKTPTVNGIDTVSNESAATTAHEVIRRIRPDTSRLVDRIVERMYAEVPIYSTGAAGPREGVVAIVRANVDDAFDRLSGDKHDLGGAIASGRTRAQQGVPLADVLTSFRMGYDVLLQSMIEAARRPPALPSDEMVDMSRSVFQLHNLVGDTLIHAYRDEARHLLLSQERERAALVNVLLSDNIGLATVAEVAAMLRLPMESEFVVVAAATQLGQDPIPRADASLSAIDVTSVWHLRQDTMVGLLRLDKPARIRQVLTVLDGHASGPVGVSPVFTPLRRAAWALGLAELVLRRHGGADRVEQFQDNPMNVLVASAPDAAQETSRTVLGDLLDLPPERRDLLLTTFNDWIEAGGSAQVAGERLNCHPNTIRHRLRRIELSTGRSLTHPGDLAELVAACRAWTQLPPQTWER